MNKQAKNKRVSRRLEKKVANDIGGRWSPSSGAVGDKGDVRLKGRYRIEHKFTKKPVYSLKLADLDKVESECYGEEKPAFVIAFVGETNKELDSVVLVRTGTWHYSTDDTVVTAVTVDKKSTRIDLEHVTQLRAMCGAMKLRSFVVEYSFGWTLVPYGTWKAHVNDHRTDD